MEKLIISALTALLGAFIGSYFGAYLRKKGENLATQEDIDKLVDQVRAVTQTAKEIEATVSNEVWDRQKRWELKREVLFEAARRLSEIDDALVAFSIVPQVEHESDDLLWKKTFNERGQTCLNASKALDEARLLVAIVCSKETKEVFDDFSLLVNEITAGINREDADAYNESSAELAKKRFTAMQAIRKELEIDRPAQLEQSEVQPTQDR